jgi:pyruvate/2-oxoglutarate dehydrogenase complex dihydrolipoamide acyltransferase (E2) component
MSLSLYGSYYLSRIGLLETTGQLPTLTRGKRRCAYRLPQRGIWQTGNYNDYATNTRFREGEEVSEDKQNKKGLGGLGSALGNVTEQVGEVAAGATEQVGEVAGGATEQVGEATQGVQDAAGQAVDQVSQTAGGLSPGLQEVTEQGQDTLGQEATGQGGQVAQDTAVQATQQAQDPAGRAAQQVNTTEQPTQQTGGGQEAAGQLSEPTSAASQKAEELGVDLAQVEGSGPGGRITLQDVMNATKQG